MFGENLVTMYTCIVFVNTESVDVYHYAPVFDTSLILGKQ